MDAVTRYHRTRVPFIVNFEDHVYVTRNYPGTHEIWSRQLGLGKAWSDFLRGFYWPPTNNLYFYWGWYTREYTLVQAQFIKLCDVIVEKVGGNDQTMIYGGMEQGEPGAIWTPVKEFGSCATVRAMRSSATT